MGRINAQYIMHVDYCSTVLGKFGKQAYGALDGKWISQPIDIFNAKIINSKNAYAKKIYKISAQYWNWTNAALRQPANTNNENRTTFIR